MSQPRNPYTPQDKAANTGDGENVSMQDSPSSQCSSEEADDAGMEDDERSQEKEPRTLEEEINFEEDFQIPPSFGRPINEETL